MAQVQLFVYDLSMGLASSLSQQLVGKQFEGIWHTSIVVFNFEYFFGGGVQRMLPNSTPYGKPVKVIPLGQTNKSQTELENYISQLGQSSFRLDTYHLFNNNCNHFSNTVATFLLEGKGIPSDILDLPNEFFTTPMGQMMRPMIDQLMGGGNVQGEANAMSSLMNLSRQQQSQPQPQQPTSYNSYGSGGGNNRNDMMSQMMNNPMAQNMLQQMGGNNDMLNQVMNNPMAQQMMNQMMSNPSLMNQMMNQFQTGNYDMNSMANQFGGMFGNNFGTNNAPTMRPSTVVSKPTNSNIDDQTIQKFIKANIPAVSKKLKDVCKEDTIVISSHDEQVLNRLETFLITEGKDSTLIDDSTFALLTRLLISLKEKNVFPVLDYLRLLVTYPSLKIVEQGENGILATIESVFLPKWQTLQMPTQLMILRTFINLFESKYNPKDPFAQYVIYGNQRQRYGVIVDIITKSLTSPLEGIRSTAASLAANLALYILRDGSDEEVQILSSVTEYLNTEQNEEVLAKMLLAMYRMLKGMNRDAVEIVKALEPNLNRFQGKPNLQTLANGIQQLLK